jgi:hypothetical protein
LKQEEYAIYKRNIAKNLGLKTHTYYIKNKFPAIIVKCKLEKEIFKYYRHKFYPNGNKTVTRSLLNLLDKEGLGIWWQDDGSLSIYENKKTKQLDRHGKLCTHSFTEEENKIISRYFNVVWDIKTTVRIEKNKYYFQHLGALGLNKLFSVISVHESMKYKTDMKYRTHASF